MVDDSSRKVARKRTSGLEDLNAGVPDSARKRGKKPAGSMAEPTLDDSLASVNHALDLIHAFDPELEREHTKEQSGWEVGFANGAPDASMESSIKLHGRPLELLCTMLKVAYANVQGPKLDHDRAVDILELVDSATRDRLEPGYVSRIGICLLSRPDSTS